MHDKFALILRGSISTYRGFRSWKKTALATAAALSLLGAPWNVYALALGAAQVKSALGEPLRAEVEVPDITSEEAATFQATLGTPQEFQTAGVDFSQALRGTRITLSHRPNGQAYLRVEGQQPVNEPFLTVVIDAKWASGHVVRDYTLLIDPPRQQAAASAAAPTQRESAPVVTSPPTRHPSVFSGTAAQPAEPPRPSPAAGAGEQVHVQPGDTAAGLAETYSVGNVSLDQMLIAMLRANPQAFIHGNVNLLRAGSVINMPSNDQAAAVSHASARRLLIAQSRDFHAYRQGLARTAARGSRMTAGRHSATGNVQPQVQETGVASAPQDRLTLSPGQSTGRAAAGHAGRAETHIAQSRHAQEQAAREAELRRNISELSQLAGASGSTQAAPASVAKASASAINTPASAAITPVAPGTASTPAAAQRAASTAVPAASAAAHRSRPALQPPVAPPPEEPSFMDTLLNPLTLGGLAAVILLLCGYGVYRSQQKKKSRVETKLDSDLFSDGKLPPDSYFGASGGQRVDTRDDSNTDVGSSMTYSPSQLEAVGDVDPVSEADVYLAYGRDAQAEEILKEALRTYPGRAPIYAKLAEIYAKQRNTRQLETIATEARRITHGEGNDWQAIANLGSKLDPDNPLYASDNEPTIKVQLAAEPSRGANARPGTQNRASSLDPQNSLDLDLSGNAPLLTPIPQAAQPAAPGEFAPRASAPYVPAAAAPTPMSISTAATEPMPLRGHTDTAAQHASGINFTPPSQAQPNSGMMEFDMSAPSPGPASRPTPFDAKQIDEDPLTTKLALAQEFHAIGDDNSARSLAKEVIAEASGTLKAKAEQFLSDLG